MPDASQGMAYVDEAKGVGSDRLASAHCSSMDRGQAVVGEASSGMADLQARGRGSLADLEAQGRGSVSELQAKGMSHLEEAKGMSSDRLADMGIDAEGLPGGGEVSEQFGMLKSVGIVLPMFYATYYAVAAVLSGALGTPFTGLEPFEHEEFTPAVKNDNLRPLVVWLSMVLTFCFFGPWIVYFAVPDSSKSVDVATTVQGMHVFATTTATQLFPENWIWWATLMPCMFFQGRLAQFMRMKFGFRLCRRRWSPVAPAPPEPRKGANPPLPKPTAPRKPAAAAAPAAVDLTTGVAAWKLKSRQARPPVRAAPTTAPHAAWFRPASGSWLGSARADWPAGTSEFMVSFDVPQPAQAHFALQYAADNSVRSASLNSKPLSIGCSAGFKTCGGEAVITAPQGQGLFVKGQNTLSVILDNGGSTPNPAGLYVRGSAVVRFVARRWYVHS